jgi:hypothetical protein
MHISEDNQGPFQQRNNKSCGVENGCGPDLEKRPQRQACNPFGDQKPAAGILAEGENCGQALYVGACKCAPLANMSFDNRCDQRLIRRAGYLEEDGTV